MKRNALLLTLIAALCVTGAALAMGSANYHLNWFTPLTSGGGGAAGSANYAANLTVGQTVSGITGGTNYAACLGYWCGEGAYKHHLYLPLVIK